MIMNPKLEEYLYQLTPLQQHMLAEMEEVAERDHVPIIERPSIQFIRTLLVYKADIRRILEIGTAIGYSAIWLAEAAPEAIVDTIERDEDRYRQAQQFVAKADLQERIQLHLGDATTYASHLQDREYDVIFIDAAKGQYKLFFEQYTSLLKSGGLVITDNVFFHGEVVAEEIEQKRIRSLVNKIKGYNEWLIGLDSFETSFVPIGDGLALSVKK